jgi:hypothetical protein
MLKKLTMITATSLVTSLSLCAGPAAAPPPGGTEMPSIWKIDTNPIANPGAVVKAGSARFTVLTPQLIRMEYSDSKVFEDAATLKFVNRNLPVPAFTHTEKNGILNIKTDAISLSYDTGKGAFNDSNLSVELLKTGTTWKPGMKNAGNLEGTTRTLDGCKGGKKMNDKTGEVAHILELEQGMISKDGWVLVDDTKAPVFENLDRPWPVQRKTTGTDWYLFAHGQEYKKALKDFVSIGGEIPIPPKYAFGVWYSKYWNYSDTEYRDLVQEYVDHRLPLDVLVIDMDWHITEGDGPGWIPGPKGLGWSGYTWEKGYFPNPGAFLKWTEEMNIQTCLNLHPAGGIQTHETHYAAFAKATGNDPEKKETIKFNMEDKKWADAYFDIMLRPLEKLGVDFWWLDWQQYQKSSITGLNNTLLNNIGHFSDMRNQGKRPLIFHRWGGLGNHRYQIGFSGDTWIDWESLDYQVPFTAKAANVGFGYWSHDIGGFGTPRGEYSTELHTRWVQFGVFSPIFRTHAGQTFSIERRPWAFPYENFRVMRDFMQLRYRLFPYFYSFAKQTHETGISLVHPMYYEYPEEEKAYEYMGQYLFGNDFLIAPITESMGKDGLFSKKKVWLPEGTWIEYSTGTVLKGNQIVERSYLLSEMPVFVKAGAVVPMMPLPDSGFLQIGNKSLGDLVLDVYPGANGETVIYDDEGTNEKYLENVCAQTKVNSVVTGLKQTITIDPVKGEFAGMTQKRNYTIRCNLTYPPTSVKVNGKDVEWTYDGEALAAVIQTGTVSVNDKTTVEVVYPSFDIQLLSGKPGICKRLIELKRKNVSLGDYWNRSKARGLGKYAFSHMGQTGLRISYDPKTITEELNYLDKAFKEFYETLTSQPDKNCDLIAELFKNSL